MRNKIYTLIVFSLLIPNVNSLLANSIQPEIIKAQLDASHEYKFSEIEGFSSLTAGIIDLGTGLSGRFDSLTLRINAENKNFSCSFPTRLRIYEYEGPYINSVGSYLIECKDQEIVTQGDAYPTFRYYGYEKVLNFEPGNYYRVVPESFYRDFNTIYGDENKVPYYVLKSTPLSLDPYEEDTQTPQEKTLSKQEMSSYMHKKQDFSQSFLKIEPEFNGEFSSFTVKLRAIPVDSVECAPEDVNGMIRIHEYVSSDLSNYIQYFLVCDPVTVTSDDTYVTYRLKQGSNPLIFKEGYTYEFIHNSTNRWPAYYVFGDKNKNIFYLLRVKAESVDPSVPSDPSLEDEEGNDETAEPSSLLPNIIFIPGHQASRLYLREDNVLNKVWEPNRNLDIEKLYLDEQGESIREILVGDPIETVTINDFATNTHIYKELFEFFDSLRDRQIINDWRALPYDWRMDPERIVSEPVKSVTGSSYSFIEEIENMASSSSNIIIGHSYGGIIAKSLIKRLEQMDKEHLIDKLILIGTPELGSPKAVASVLHGEAQRKALGIIIDKQHAIAFSRNMPSAYMFLPQDDYFDQITDSVITIQNQPSTQYLYSAYGPTIESKGELDAFLKGQEGRPEPDTTQTYKPIIVNKNLLDRGRTIQENLKVWQIPESIEELSFAGVGIETLDGIEYYEQTNTFCLELLGCSRFDYKPRFTTVGDKTVLTESANESDLPYYLDLSKYQNDTNKSYRHENIVGFPPLLQSLENMILSGNVQENSYLFSIKPMVPSSDKLLISVHSPVTITVTDKQGNQTGKSSIPQTDIEIEQHNIPGSEYLEFGEGKYVLVDPHVVEDIMIKGYGEGRFTVDLLDLRTGGYYSFKEIPTGTTTIAHVSLAPVIAESILTLDNDGDGIPDQSYDLYEEDVEETEEIVSPVPEENPISQVSSGSSGGAGNSEKYRRPKVLGVLTHKEELLQTEVSDLILATRSVMTLIEQHYPVIDKKTVSALLESISKVLTSYSSLYNAPLLTQEGKYQL